MKELVKNFEKNLIVDAKSKYEKRYNLKENDCCSFSGLRFSNFENNQDIRNATYRIIAEDLKFLSSH